ncbi:hypothetical protein QYF36_022066 [Acer negundo]|nr:hypothetical protein QYF36_022066 [Acer negundo]
MGKFKLKCAAIIDIGGNKIGIGAIIRDSECEVLSCCSQIIVANYTIKIANLISILKGLQFTVDYGLSPNVIETNDVDMVNWISNGLHSDSDFRTILLKIRKISDCLKNLIPRQVSISANKAAIGLANHSLNLVEDAFLLEEFSDRINSIIELDKADMLG